MEPKGSGFLPPYRILDLADEKGVFCGKILADMGAEVIKIEPPGGDKTRSWAPFYHNEIHPEKSLYFLYYNTSKRSVTLNLEHSDGRDLFKRLVKTADVVIETFPPGSLKKLGLGYDHLRKINPRIVLASITAFGQTGRYAKYKSSDLITMGMSGYMQVTGDPDGPPLRLGNEHSHFPASQYGASAILAALYYRDTQSGKGQHVDVSVQEALLTYYLEQVPAAYWLHHKQNVTRSGLNSPVLIPGGLYPCKDGWVSMLVATADEWETLARWIYEVKKNEDILDPKYKGVLYARQPYRDVLTAYFMDFTVEYTKQDFFMEAQKRGLVALPANTPEDLVKDPQLTARGFWVELDHPIVGKLKYCRGALYSDDMPPPGRAAPLLGEYNEQVYCREMGFSLGELTSLRSSGVI